MLPKDTAAGEFDLYVMLAARYRWTPEQVNDLDPLFLEELLVYHAAEARHDDEQRKEAERRARQARAGR